MKKKEKTRKEKFKEAQKLDQSIAKLLKELTKIVGDREVAEGMVFFDFGYRNICGFTEFVPKGKDPNAVILKEKVGFDLRKRHEYSHETLMRIYWQLLKVGIGTTVKYLRLLDEMSMSFRDGLEIKSVEQYEKFFEKEHEEIMGKLGFRV